MIKKNYKQQSNISLNDQLKGYTELANSFCKIGRQKSKKRLLKNAHLAALTPLAAAALMTNTLNAQLCTSGLNVSFTLPNGQGFGIDVDGDGDTDVGVGYFSGATPGLFLANFGGTTAFSVPATGAFSYAVNFASGQVVNAAAANAGFGRLYTGFNGNQYGNFIPGANGTGTVVFVVDGNMGFIELTVTGLNTFTLLGFGAEQGDAGTDGGTDGFGTMTVSSACPNNTLFPVEYTYFKALEERKNIVLKWETSQEINNSGFEIQRSTDNKNFYKVGWVEGHETTHETIKYDFVDETAKVNVLYYYRLKQMDKDGQFEYSDLVDIMLKDENSVHVSDIYPNPVAATGFTQIKINVANKTDAQMNIFNQQGQVIQSLRKTLTSGGDVWEISTADMVKGSYFAKIQVGEEVVYKKFIVQ